MFVWKDITHNQAEKGDWFYDWRVIDYLTKKEESVNGGIQQKYCQALEKLELAVLAKKSISKFKSENWLNLMIRNKSKTSRKHLLVLVNLIIYKSLEPFEL